MSDHLFEYVGTRPVRHDGVDKVTGRANYGADLDLPGLLHGMVVRSPHAHARIVAIDTRAAREMEGVKAVITAQDLPECSAIVDMGELPIVMKDVSDNVLARTKVLYHGHAVAAVAATTREIAEAAVARIEVEYEPLAPVLDVMEAAGEQAEILHPDLVTRGADEAAAPARGTNVAERVEFARGDLTDGFAEADVVVERSFRTRMVHQGYIEPHACVARVGEDDQIIVWCSTQGPFLVRDQCAAILDVERSRIKVIPSEIGGGFGGKIPVYLEPLAIALSRQAHRPVKMVMTRAEVFRASGPTSGTVMHVKMGAKRDGTLTAADVSLWYEAGAYPGSPAGAGAMCCLAAYRIPHFRIHAYDVVVNKPKVAAYRAPGSPMATFAIESVMDDLARQLSLDAIALRQRNAVGDGDRATFGPKYGPIGLQTILAAAAQHPHWSAPLGPNQGRGVACGFWFNAGMNSSATVLLNADGGASVITGNPDIGGTRVAQAMMVAEELGIPVERVRPSVADTDSVGYTDLTGGSRVCYATGMAVIEAARDVREQLCQRAALIWDVPRESVRWERNRVVRGTNGQPGDALGLEELATKMTSTGGAIVGRGTVSVPRAGPGFAVHLCDVEVDPDTGQSRVVRYTAFQDVGRAVHPGFVEGQIQGGVAQGIGWALNEEYIYDDQGVMLNAGFLDYRMPVASDLPWIETVLIEVANPLHPYGVRGVGEVPIVPPLGAVANAMRDATGIRFCELPLSPPRVLEALHAERPAS